MPPQPSSDLRVLCRKLTSLSPTQLPRSLPSLVNHVLRSKDALSAPQDPKAKGDASETSGLVHKFKTNVNTLLNSRTREARFVAISLVKAAVDVGGWEILQGTEPWVRGLLSIVQKGDPYASKELAIVTLTKIFILLHPFQTLVREIATPKIPEFAKACLQVIKPTSPDELSAIPPSIIESVCDSFSTLIPLYPATFRPSNSQTYNAIRSFLVPTLSDEFIAPASLQRAARRLAITQHFVAAKSGGSDEWARLADTALHQFHVTADQVFRAVDESWEGSSERGSTKVSLEGEPSGGGSGPNEFPSWSGIDSGAARLSGLLEFISNFLSYPTKGSVTIPVGRIMDAISRVCLIARLSPKTQTWAQSLQTKAAISRDEKEDLWSLMPDLHVAALHVVQVMISRLDQDMIPAATEALDHLVRVFSSGIAIPAVRAAGYAALNDILPLAGPTLSKPMVDALAPILKGCCRDLQEDSGCFKASSKPTATGATNTKKNGFPANADSFLKQPQEASDTIKSPLEPEHKAAASALLVSAFSHLPQEHLKSLRSLLDQTAVLTSNRDAMLSSVLNPYSDQRGRPIASLLPYLTQQYPHDRLLEVIRSNLRTDIFHASKLDQTSPDADADEEVEEDDEDEDMADDDQEDGAAAADEHVAQTLQPGTLPAAPRMDIDMPTQDNPFQPKVTEKHTVYGGFGDVQARAESPPKRKHEGSSPVPPKRQEVHSPRDPAPAATAPLPGPIGGEEDDDSDESVHLVMDLEGEEDSEGDA